MIFNKSRHGVELHIHLDGGFRPSTVFEYARRKCIYVPGNNECEFEKSLKIEQANSLSSFLQTFDYLLPPIAGDAVCLTP